MQFKTTLLILSTILSTSLWSQSAPTLKEKSLDERLKRAEEILSFVDSIKLRMRGYAQVRYNRLLETNPDLKCEQCDRSLGDKGGFFLRRARVILYGDVSPNVYFYFQPDFASQSGNEHYAQMRDIYFDVSLNPSKSHRLRFGQSKVPFGFENMQSSQNRLALDRNDGLNSAVSNERDMGVFYYWASPEKRTLFRELVRNNLKGSGDYGIFGLGIYNGQTANKTEQNNNLHIVTRLTYPFEIGENQVLEPAIQAYHGRFVTNTNEEFRDARQALSLTLYPKPFGFQAEYNIGVGPEFDPTLNRITSQSLSGGYAQISYNFNYQEGFIVPFLKYQRYNGGKKHETGAPSYRVKEIDLGIEWRMNQTLELVLAHSWGERTIARSTGVSDEEGSRLRMQLQINF